MPGVKYSKRPIGRPPKFRSVKEMETKIEAYFKACEGKPFLDNEGKPFLNKNGEPIYIDKQPLTITGLALALGFTSRLALLNYEDKPEFVNTVTRAKAKVEQFAEAALFSRDAANGAKFALANNFRSWKEQQQLEVANKPGEKIELNISSLDTEELRKLADKL